MCRVGQTGLDSTGMRSVALHDTFLNSGFPCNAKHKERTSGALENERTEMVSRRFRGREENVNADKIKS